ncbi:MAG TPA: SDR family oxidoreductase [Bryobacteraceae bacterium]|nr:SDR family oxidoreductase [Bryobacteraceae bacterium]
MDRELTGKTALVTGASRGIGAATALALANNGASRLILHYNSHRPGIDAVIAAVERAGVEAAAIQADLGTSAGVESFLQSLKATGAGVDILVNNAGSLVQRAKLADFTPELFDRVITLNVKSAWFIAQAVAPHMIARKSGFIVNVSSIAARNGGGIGATVYAAAKAAVAAMTKGMMKELAPCGIRVNAVSPGTVDNNFHAQFSTRHILDAVVAATPAGTLGTNEEVADTIVFLCSPAARYIHGQTIEINGGMFTV